MVLTWEAEVVAAAEAAETNWKHKVTPDRADLKMISEKSTTLEAKA